MRASSSGAHNESLLHQMLVEGVLSSQMHEAALTHMQAHGVRAEEALIGARVMSEAELLRHLAVTHRTNFVSTERLHAKKVDAAILALVPKKLAVTHGVLPVLYDAAKNTLAVVTADPDDLAMVNEVKVAAGVREVKAIVARPAAVRAAIARAYENDSTGFFGLLYDRHGFSLDVDRSAIPEGLRDAHGPPAAPPAPPAARKPVPIPKPIRRAPLPSQPEELDEVELESEPPPPRPAPPRRTLPITFPMYLETMRVLVGQAEPDRPGARGHAAACADLMKRLAERMRLPPATVDALELAGLLHDVGKNVSHHLTPLVIAQDGGANAAARELYDTPARLLKGAGLPPATLDAMTSMYERYDGRGFPEGLAGEAIPLGARLLAVADAYTHLDLRASSGRASLAEDFAPLDVMSQNRGLTFDPAVVDLLSAELQSSVITAR